MIKIENKIPTKVNKEELYPGDTVVDYDGDYLLVINYGSYPSTSKRMFVNIETGAVYDWSIITPVRVTNLTLKEEQDA